MSKKKWIISGSLIIAVMVVAILAIVLVFELPRKIGDLADNASPIKVNVYSLGQQIKSVEDKEELSKVNSYTYKLRMNDIKATTEWNLRIYYDECVIDINGYMCRIYDKNDELINSKKVYFTLPVELAQYL